MEAVLREVHDHNDEPVNNVVQFPLQQKMLCRNERPIELIGHDTEMHRIDAAQEAWDKRKRVDEIRSVTEINKFIRFFLDQDRVRDALFFIIQCNTGLRASDVIVIRWGDIFKNEFRLKMQKTNREIDVFPNQTIHEAAALYKRLSDQPCCDEDYVFISNSRRKGHTPVWDRKGVNRTVRAQTIEIQPLRVETISRIMTQAGKDSGVATPDCRISSHSGRKIHANAMDDEGIIGFNIGQDLLMRASKIHMAQRALGHAKPETTTAHYLARERELHKEACSRMHFGLEEIRAYKQRKGID